MNTNSHPATPLAASSTHSTSAPQTSATASPGTTTEHLKSAGEHLQHAARKAVSAIPNANAAATQVLKDGYAEIAPDLAAAKREASEAGSAAAASTEKKWNEVVAQGKSALERSEQFVRERPLAAVGIAVASGFLLSKLIRR